MLLQVACTFAPIWGSLARRGPYVEDGAAVVGGVVAGGAVVGGEVVAVGAVVGDVVVGDVVVGGAVVVVVLAGALTLAAGAVDAEGVLNGPHAARRAQPTITPATRCGSPKLRIPCLSAVA
ncbi:MAG TPA: hypothetical protein VLV81_06185 [Acidimicrobiia bacterium]|nr:hypothetical protein [Acidimicrobiia bacterium]